jgi:hypothetical protein
MKTRAVRDKTLFLSFYPKNLQWQKMNLKFVYWDKSWDAIIGMFSTTNFMM